MPFLVLSCRNQRNEILILPEGKEKGLWLTFVTGIMQVGTSLSYSFRSSSGWGGYDDGTER